MQAQEKLAIRFSQLNPVLKIHIPQPIVSVESSRVMGSPLDVKYVTWIAFIYTP